MIGRIFVNIGITYTLLLQFDYFYIYVYLKFLNLFLDNIYKLFGISYIQRNVITFIYIYIFKIQEKMIDRIFVNIGIIITI